jgi:hypothetical protein
MTLNLSKSHQISVNPTRKNKNWWVRDNPLENCDEARFRAIRLRHGFPFVKTTADKSAGQAGAARGQKTAKIAYFGAANRTLSQAIAGYRTLSHF